MNTNTPTSKRSNTQQPPLTPPTPTAPPHSTPHSTPPPTPLTPTSPPSPHHLSTRSPRTTPPITSQQTQQQGSQQTPQHRPAGTQTNTQQEAQTSHRVALSAQARTSQATEEYKPIKQWEDLLEELPKNQLGQQLLKQHGHKAWQHLETLLTRHPYLQERHTFDRGYHHTIWYLVLQRAQHHGQLKGIMHNTLGYATGISQTIISRYLRRAALPRLLDSLYANERVRQEYEKHLTVIAKQRRIDPSFVYNVIQPFNNHPENHTPEHLANAIQQFINAKPDQTIIFAELHPYLKCGPQWLRTIATAINTHRIQIQNILNHANPQPNHEYRVGVANYTVYIWRRNTDPDNWLNLYAQEIYYFNTCEEKFQLVEAGRNHLALKEYQHLRRLTGQLTDHRGKRHGPIASLQPHYPHMKGETLHLLLDATHQTLQDTQPHLQRIGQGARQGGRIFNPQFPPLEPLRTRLIAVMFSDGHLADKHQATYAESNPERREYVKALFSLLGDVEIRDKPNPITKVPHLHIPAVVGRLLERWGMPIGDKTIQNPSLPHTITEGPNSLKLAYLQEVIPEDGNFNVNPSQNFPTFEITRSIALDAGIKSERYQFDSMVSRREIELIHKFGRKMKSDLIVQCSGESYEILWRTLKKLGTSKDSEVACLAKNLMKTVLENPCKLILDEVQLCEDLGITLILDLDKLAHYGNSGRVSARWRARTQRIDDAIRFALIAPPSDQRKRAVVWEMLRSRVDQTRRVALQLEKQGYKYYLPPELAEK